MVIIPNGTMTKVIYKVLICITKSYPRYCLATWTPDSWNKIILPFLLVIFSRSPPLKCGLAGLFRCPAALHRQRKKSQQAHDVAGKKKILLSRVPTVQGTTESGDCQGNRSRAGCRHPPGISRFQRVARPALPGSRARFVV